MQCFCYQLFAGTALAGDEHRGIGVGYAFYGSEYVVQFAAFAYDVTAVELSFDYFFLLNGFSSFASQLKGGLYALHQSYIVPRLCYKVERACLHTFDCKVYAAPCCHQYDGNIGAEYLYLFQQIDSLLAAGGKGEVHIHEYKFGLSGANYFYCLFG